MGMLEWSSRVKTDAKYVLNADVHSSILRLIWLSPSKEILLYTLWGEIVSQNFLGLDFRREGKSQWKYLCLAAVVADV